MALCRFSLDSRVYLCLFIMMKLFLNLYVTLFMGQAYACPLCMGQDPKDKYYLYVLGTFVIIVTLVILYVLKVCHSYKNINNSPDNESQP